MTMHLCIQKLPTVTLTLVIVQKALVIKQHRFIEGADSGTVKSMHGSNKQIRPCEIQTMEKRMYQNDRINKGYPNFRTFSLPMMI